jgi:hypothetical protein
MTTLPPYEQSWEKYKENTEEMKKMQEKMAGYTDMYLSGSRENIPGLVNEERKDWQANYFLTDQIKRKNSVITSSYKMALSCYEIKTFGPQNSLLSIFYIVALKSTVLFFFRNVLHF